MREANSYDCELRNAQGCCMWSFANWLDSLSARMTRIQPLESSNQTNWFTQNAPQALLYGTLLQAMPFLKNDERIPMWEAQYTKVIEALKLEDISRVGDRQTVVRDA